MWRERDKSTIRNTKETLKYLSDYRWSSYLDYCDKKNFPSIITKNLFGNVFENYQDAIKDYLKAVEISSTTDLILE